MDMVLGVHLPWAPETPKLEYSYFVVPSYVCSLKIVNKTQESLFYESSRIVLCSHVVLEFLKNMSWHLLVLGL